MSVVAGEVDDLSGRDPPVQVPDAIVDVVLVDVTRDIWDHLSPFNPGVHSIEMIHAFNPERVSQLPMVDAQKDPPNCEQPRFIPRVDESGTSTDHGGDHKLLCQRTEVVKGQLATNPSRPSALRQPLGDLTTGGLHSPFRRLATFLEEMPAPRSTSTRTPTRQPGTSVMEAPGVAAQVKELEKEKEEESSWELTKAILAQSQALSTLVQQMATGDLGVESSGSFGMSIKGAQGRARLQQELALHRGTFFNDGPPNATFSACRYEPNGFGTQGVVASHYVERFGGYGRSRELGHIMWQVALILDHLQNENLGAAKDGAALLTVCLEQAGLDSGRMDTGLLLALQEDPPAGVFTNRNLAGYARGKAFAPLADQKWITNALSYIKELDLIVSKRADANIQRTPKEDPSSSTSLKRAPKRQPRGSWKKKGDQQEEGEQ